MEAAQFCVVSATCSSPLCAARFSFSCHTLELHRRYTAIKTGRPNNVSIVIVDLRSRAALQETVKFIRAKITYEGPHVSKLTYDGPN
jgi:hypothetical protein